ncbi:MAG: hypothetical protein JO102_01125 [Elusimicrobia bacterium]|nr:hypothetical protein [Elusimicrobiota bacterium]
MKTLLFLLVLLPSAAHAEPVSWFCEGDRTVYAYKAGKKGHATLYFLDKQAPQRVDKEKVSRVDEEVGVNVYYWTFMGSGSASFTAMQTMVRSDGDWGSWPYLVQRCRGQRPSKNIYAGCVTRTRTAYVEQEPGKRGARALLTRDFGNSINANSMRATGGRISKKGNDFEVAFNKEGLTYRLNLREPASLDVLKGDALLERETCLFTAADREALSDWIAEQDKH